MGSKKNILEKIIIILALAVIVITGFYGHNKTTGYFNRQQEYQMDEMSAEFKLINDQGGLYQDIFIIEIAEYAAEASHEHDIFPSIIIAQAILESNWGRSELAKEHNNLHGIKSDEEGKSVEYLTDEFEEGALEAHQEFAGFETFDHPGESVIRHAELMELGTRYDSELYAGVSQAVDYKEAAHALQEAGYATDPDYADKLITIIEKYGLNTYDD